MAEGQGIWKTEQRVNNAEDFKTDFQTPPFVAKYMASLIPAGVETVLEPTPGQGNIVRELNRYQVTAPEDYFLLDKDQRFDCIVMNPPFSHKYCILDNAPIEFHKAGMKMGYQILLECMRMSDNVIALMPWFTLSDSDLRLRTLKNYGIKSLTALPRKTFQYARIQTVVIEMERGFKGTSAFHTLEERQSGDVVQLEFN
ncbi:MAG: hypothetical protein NXI20_17915 [bacterium]|nr:hypothetical protein [bacterium]